MKLGPIVERTILMRPMRQYICLERHPQLLTATDNIEEQTKQHENKESEYVTFYHHHSYATSKPTSWRGQGKNRMLCENPESYSRPQVHRFRAQVLDGSKLKSDTGLDHVRLHSCNSDAQ